MLFSSTCDASLVHCGPKAAALLMNIKAQQQDVFENKQKHHKHQRLR